MTVLFINACVRPESRTKILADEVLKYLDGQVKEIDLGNEAIMPLTRKSLEERNELLKKQNLDDPSFKYAHAFAKADEIVIAAPFWDLSFPASLKSFIEAVNVSGITFRYTQQGTIEGLCKAKRLIYVTSAGGKIGKENCGFGYVKSLCEHLYGIHDLVFIKAEGLDIWGADVDQVLNSAKKEIADILGKQDKCRVNPH